MKHTRFARWLIVSLGLSGATLVLTSLSFAAEEASSMAEEVVVEESPSEVTATIQDPASLPEQTAEEIAEATGEKQEELQPPKKAEESPDVFNPSEEISEDFAVAFPVDI